MKGTEEWWQLRAGEELMAECFLDSGSKEEEALMIAYVDERRHAGS